MRKIPEIAFVLIVLLLIGIIVFQAYWATNSYHIKKEKFDVNIDIAMQRAMDDCKKDYFDSLRTVIAKRLSAPETKLKVDTMTSRADHSIQYIYIDSISNLFYHVHDDRLIPFFQVVQYEKRIGHKASLNEIVAEASFDTPALMSNLLHVFANYDIAAHGILGSSINGYNSEIDIPGAMNFNPNLQNTIYGLQKNYRQSDSLKISAYFKMELERMHIQSPFSLNVSTKTSTPGELNAPYSETNDYSYKYHGFKYFMDKVGQEFFVRAVFKNPQSAIIKGMMITLVLSALLIVFTVFCFWYMINTIVQQKILAELKDDFINNMTHELKTPIATMTVAIEGLQKFNALNDAEKTQRYLQTSKNELTRLNDIVSRVLNVAAFGNKEAKLMKEKINIDDLINDIIDSEQVKAYKKVTITYENKSNIKTINADKLHFRNVLVNLVDNAIKYSEEPVLINITCYKVNVNVLFSVRDNGIGIPNAHISQIFNKFHRVPTGNVHNVKGTGLGLSYIKYVVEAHGGNVIAQSEVNKGSDFTISIPVGNE